MLFLDNLREITCQNYFEIHCKCLRNDKGYLQRDNRKQLFYRTRFWDKSTINKKYIICISLCKLNEWIKILSREPGTRISAKRRWHKNTPTMVNFKVQMSWQSICKIPENSTTGVHSTPLARGYFKSAGNHICLINGAGMIAYAI